MHVIGMCSGWEQVAALMEASPPHRESMVSPCNHVFDPKYLNRVKRNIPWVMQYKSADFTVHSKVEC